MVIDNIDSFVYNIVQYIGELGAKPKVVMNNTNVEKIEKLNPEKIVISPGPGRPENAGNSIKIIQRFGSKK